jgi:trans-2-enoyl-CoA reductase
LPASPAYGVYISQLIRYNEKLYQVVEENGINIGRFKTMQFLNNQDVYSLQKKSLMIQKGAIRIHKWRKDRQHNSQKKQDKRTKSDLQNIHTV